MSLFRAWLLLTTALAGTLLAADATPLDQAFARLQTFDWKDSREALAPIAQAFEAGQTNTHERLALERRLAAVLGSSAPRAAKAFACRQLSLAGTAESVPNLARLLVDPDLAHLARVALERIPDARAAESLRQSLPSVKGNLQAGVINSLGNLKDPLAVPLLTGLLQSLDSDTVGAALLALGKIGTVEAAQALDAFRASPPPELRARGAEASLMAAESLARSGRLKESDALFRALYATEQDSRLRLGAFRGLLTLANPERGSDLLARALAGTDAELRELAADWISGPADDTSVRRLCERLRDLPTAGQAALLDALGVRGEQACAGVARNALTSPAAEVRAAALRAMARLGDVSDLPALLRRSASADAQESAAARFALANLPGKDVDKQLARRLQEAGPEAPALLQCLTARHSPGAADIIVSLLQKPGPARTSALEALAGLGDERQVPVLMPLLKAPEPATQEGARRALQAIVARTRVRSLDALNDAYQTGDSATKVFLVQQFGAIAGPRALQSVRLALADSEPAVREAAFAVVADWPGPGAAPDLLKLARTAENPSWKALAFRGLVRLCRDADMTFAQRLKNLAEAATLAARTEDKLLLISAWAAIPEPEALSQIAACLKDPDLAEAAGLAIASAVPKLDAKHQDTTVLVLRQVVQTCSQTNVQEQARVALRRLEAKGQP